MEEKHYHHGDLKQELIQKGIQLLAHDGYEGFSMRKLAAACGVSHAAPYKHFKSKEEIVLTISQVIAGEFNAALSEAVSRWPADPRMQLIGMCRQYVRFLVEHPDYFRFVFMTAHGRPIEITAQDILTGERSPLVAARACAEAWFRPINGDGWLTDFMAVWGMIHGYTLMLVCQTVQVEGDYLDLVQKMVEGYLAGNNQALSK